MSVQAMSVVDFRAEIHEIAMTSFGQWEQAKLPSSAREDQLNAAIDGLLGSDAPYTPVLERLRYDGPPPKYVTFGVDRPMAQIISRAWYDWQIAHGHKVDADGNVSRPLSPERKKWAHLSVRLRPQILARDNYTCQQCGADESTVKLHIDHIVPLAKGGSNDPSNLQVLCQPCNQRKWAH